MSFIGKKILIRGSDNFYTNLLRTTDKNKGLFEPRREKTGLRNFRPGLTQTGLCSYRSRLEA